MTDQPSGNPRWASTSGRRLPLVPEPERVSGSDGIRSVADWLGWSPTRWRAEACGPQPQRGRSEGSGR